MTFEWQAPQPEEDPQPEKGDDGDPWIVCNPISDPLCKDDDEDLEIVFYRGGTYYDLLSTQDEGPDRIIRRQAGREFEPGFYTSTNWHVARYFGSNTTYNEGYGGGQGGEAMMTIILRVRDFEALRLKYNIEHNRPVEGLSERFVPPPHVETLFPFASLPEVFSLAKIIVMPIIE